MGLRRRMRARPVSRAVIDQHNRHAKVTWADPELATKRNKARQANEQREAEWYMSHKYGDPSWTARD